MTIETKEDQILKGETKMKIIETEILDTISGLSVLVKFEYDNKNQYSVLLKFEYDSKKYYIDYRTIRSCNYKTMSSDLDDINYATLFNDLRNDDKFNELLSEIKEIQK